MVAPHDTGAGPGGATHPGREPAAGEAARDATRGGVNVPIAGDEHEPPPVLGSWRRLYALVLGGLVLVIALLALLERSFR